MFLVFVAASLYCFALYPFVAILTLRQPILGSRIGSADLSAFWPVARPGATA